MDPHSRRLLRASRLLFWLSGPILAAGFVAIYVGAVAAEEIAERLLARLLAEIDPNTLAELPSDFLTASTVQRAAWALAAGLFVLGVGQLLTAVELRRGARWSYAAAVMGGLLVAFTCGTTAVFMLAATSSQPQAALLLTVGAVGLGLVAALYGAVAAFTASGRREREAATG